MRFGTGRRIGCTDVVAHSAVNSFEPVWALGTVTGHWDYIWRAVHFMLWRAAATGGPVCSGLCSLWLCSLRWQPKSRRTAVDD